MSPKSKFSILLAENNVQQSNVFVRALDIVDHAAAALDVVVVVVAILLVVIMILVLIVSNVVPWSSHMAPLLICLECSTHGSSSSPPLSLLPPTQSDVPEGCYLRVKISRTCFRKCYTAETASNKQTGAPERRQPFSTRLRIRTPGSQDLPCRWLICVVQCSWSWCT